MKYALHLASFLLFSTLLAACGLPMAGGIPRVQGGTPEEVARRHIPNLGRPAPSLVQIHGTRETPQGVVVLYTARIPSQGGPPYSPNLGYVLTKQEDGAWHVRESTYGGAVAEAGQMIEYRTGPLGSGNEQAWIVYGRRLTPHVFAVEALFDNGQVVRDQLTDDMFGIVAAGATTVCEIRLLDSEAHILGRLNPAHAQTVDFIAV